MRHIICLDVDGVLRPFIERTKELFKQEHNVKAVGFTGDKDFCDCFHPFDKNYIRKFIFKDKVLDIFYNVKPYPKAKEGFDFLNNYCDEHNKQLIIVSSQVNYYTKLLTLMWLKHYEMLTDNLSFTIHPNKFIIEGYYLIDDELSNLNEWSKKGRCSICFSRAWNKEWKGLRISNLKQVPALLK